MKTAVAIGLLIGLTAWAQAGDDTFIVMDPAVLAKERAEREEGQRRNLRLKQERDLLREAVARLEQANEEDQIRLDQIRLAANLADFLFNRTYRVWTTAKGSQVMAKATHWSPSLVNVHSRHGQDLTVGVAVLASLDQIYLRNMDRLRSLAYEPAAASEIVLFSSDQTPPAN